MSDFRDELSLVYCLLINAAVFGSAWFFARRRMTASRSQAVLDAALIGYAVQYVSIGLPGLLRCLNFGCVTGTAMVCAIGLFASGRRAKPADELPVWARDRFIVAGAALFAVSFVLAFAYKQADLPPISNDAITYHFPAAVQWMQQGRISVFQTWFFNPSNTYSPLAGSMFILWLILPFGSDVLARFVEIPALFCVGLALYRLCREMSVSTSIAALIAAAMVLCRPIFLPCMMGKDDLFVAFFMITSLVALSRNRAAEPRGSARLGIALGLLLATKYTALLSVPILLFAVEGPKWTVKKWCVAAGSAVPIAGPWYLRNWIMAGNPVFPLGSLFTTVRSDSFHSSAGAIHMVLGNWYGLPVSIAIAGGVALILACVIGWRMALVRACSLGSAAGIAIFFALSPFPEVRFLLPVFCVMFACVAYSIEKVCREERLGVIAGVAMVILSVGTLFPGVLVDVTLPFAIESLTLVSIGLLAMWWTGKSRVRRLGVGGFFAAAIFVFAYINWSAFCVYDRRTRFVDGAGYSLEYPQLTRLWNFVDQNIPVDATVAYANLYFVYPLQGGSLQRRLIYVPTRHGVESIADIGWLGKNLSGERLVPAAIRATLVSPDRATWLGNLQKSGAKYLVVGRNGLADVPPEEAFAQSDPRHFSLLYEGASGWVYRVNSPSLSS